MTRTGSSKKMHADEVDTDVSLVRRLLAAQLPHWAELPIEPVPSSGTDNALYRLGDDKVVRLPRRPGAVASVEKEQEWLPRVAPHLPLTVPVPLAKGTAGEGYPWSWCVYPWIDGESPTSARASDLKRLAADLAGFVAALHRIEPDGPRPGLHNFFRGVGLERREGWTRKAIDALGDSIDRDAVTAAWESALAAPVSDSRVWIHGDLKAENLLVEAGRLRAVIDFGGLGVGDPAVDLIIAWDLLSAERDVYRAALGVDDAMWARGRGWALSVALVALPYYRDTNPVIAASARKTISEVLADHEAGA